MEALLHPARQQLLAALDIFLAWVDGWRGFNGELKKVGLISSVTHWIALRDLRNRIAHEYLPGEMAKIYATMVTDGAQEFRRLRQVAEKLH